MSAIAAVRTRQKSQVPETRAGILQRACACGQHTGSGGECADCKKKRIGLQRQADSQASQSTAPPIVHEVLRSPGRPLDPGTRALMETQLSGARFHYDLSSVPAQRNGSMPARLAIGAPRDAYEWEADSAAQSVMNGSLRLDEKRYDFSRVRIHTGDKAAASARAVNARAYTVGHDIVFGDGRFAAGTSEGRRLLAHELTHVVQQNQEVSRLQRWADCTPARLSGEDCPARTPGERSDARTSPMLFYSNFTDLASGSSGALIANFDIGSARIKPDLSANQDWQDFLTGVETYGSRWRLLGFSDCEGGEAPNLALRGDRAEAVKNAFPSRIRSQVLAQEAAPINDCFTENSNASERSFNRSVAIIYDSTSITFPDETVEVTPPDYVCGPDVTTQIADAVAATGAAFAGWSSDEKEDACDALDSISTGACAWDIVDLHNNAWIYQNYRPTCASQGATPPCGSTIQVGDECYYAGSANYVIFGKMCKLCADYYLSVPLINTGYARFTRSAMEDLIDLYKGSGFTGLGSPSGNFRESVDWANAGYDGWPSGGSQPAGDRSNCVPVCPTAYQGPAFRVEWAPHMDPYGCGR